MLAKSAIFFGGINLASSMVAFNEVPVRTAAVGTKLTAEGDRHPAKKRENESLMMELSQNYDSLPLTEKSLWSLICFGYAISGIRSQLSAGRQKYGTVLATGYSVIKYTN